MWCGYRLGCELGLVSVIAHTDCSCRCVGCCASGGGRGERDEMLESLHQWPGSRYPLYYANVYSQKNVKYFASRVSAQRWFPVSSFLNSFLSCSSFFLSAYSAKAKPNPIGQTICLTSKKLRSSSNIFVAYGLWVKFAYGFDWLMSLIFCHTFLETRNDNLWNDNLWH